MSFVVGFNVATALLASLVAFGALNKIRWGTTRPCVLIAYFLIAVGAAAQALGELSSQWDHLADTALFGGVLSLLIASQREKTWLIERWANPLASIAAATALSVFAYQLFLG